MSSAMTLTISFWKMTKNHGVTRLDYENISYILRDRKFHLTPTAELIMHLEVTCDSRLLPSLLFAQPGCLTCLYENNVTTNIIFTGFLMYIYFL